MCTCCVLVETSLVGPALKHRSPQTGAPAAGGAEREVWWSGHRQSRSNNRTLTAVNGRQTQVWFGLSVFPPASQPLEALQVKLDRVSLRRTGSCESGSDLPSLLRCHFPTVPQLCQETTWLLTCLRRYYPFALHFSFYVLVSKTSVDKWKRFSGPKSSC